MQRKNLLEAFRHAGSQPAQEPDSAGPFAGGEPARPRGRSKRPKASSGASGAPAVPSWAPWVLGILVAFVVGLAVGRGTAPVVADAAERDSASAADTSRWQAEPSSYGSERPNGGSGAQAAPNASRASTGGRAAEDAKTRFLDTTNRYTIVGITYGRSRRDYADASCAHLRDQGFDVMPLVEYGDNYVVLIGAAPEVDDLRAVRERLTRAEGFDGSPAAYADAYIEQIDRLFDR